MARHIEITVTAIEMIESDCADHRELIQQKFLKKGYHVVNWKELKYFANINNQNQFYFKVEGNIGVAILSR
jgi:hypothetical protein